MLCAKTLLLGNAFALLSTVSEHGAAILAQDSRVPLCALASWEHPRLRLVLL